MGIPDHLTCLLRNLYAGQEATVRTGHGTADWLQIRVTIYRLDVFLSLIWSQSAVPCPVLTVAS